MDRQARIRTTIDENVGFVARTLRKAGVPPSELDDEIQRTFITVARRLDDVREGAERSFVFQVALNMAAHARRDLARRREVLPGEMPSERVEAIATPEYLTQRKQLRTLLDGIVASMDEPLRAVFILHIFEGMDQAQIAARLGVPRGTVSSRLRRARAQIRQNTLALELAADLGAPDAACLPEPPPLRREKGSVLRRALLDIGTSLRSSAAICARTLAVLGLASGAEMKLAGAREGRS